MPQTAQKKVDHVQNGSCSTILLKKKKFSHQIFSEEIVLELFISGYFTVEQSHVKTVKRISRDK